MRTAATADEVQRLGSSLHDWFFSLDDLEFDAQAGEVRLPVYEPIVTKLRWRFERLDRPARPTHRLRILHATAPPDVKGASPGFPDVDLLGMHAEVSTVQLDAGPVQIRISVDGFELHLDRLE